MSGQGDGTGQDGPGDQLDVVLGADAALDAAEGILKRQERQFEHQHSPLFRNDRWEQRAQVGLEPLRGAAAQQIVSSQLDEHRDGFVGNGTRLRQSAGQGGARSREIQHGEPGAHGEQRRPGALHRCTESRGKGISDHDHRFVRACAWRGESHAMKPCEREAEDHEEKGGGSDAVPFEASSQRHSPACHGDGKHQVRGNRNGHGREDCQCKADECGGAAEDRAAPAGHDSCGQQRQGDEQGMPGDQEIGEGSRECVHVVLGRAARRCASAVTA